MKVILTADDFGRSSHRNIAIDLAFKNRLISSSALMVSTDFTEEAVNFATIGGYVNRLHCHFNLCGGNKAGYARPLTDEIARDIEFCGLDGCFLPYTGKAFASKNKIFSIVKFYKVYKELCAQYKEFIRLTGGKGNNTHVDFHLYYNMNWPVAIALNLFSITHKIKTIRYVGLHDRNNRLFSLFRMLSWNPFVMYIPACNIDYWLNSFNQFKNIPIVELYVHPDIVNGELQDNSISVYGNEKKSLADNISAIKKISNITIISWDEL